MTLRLLHLHLTGHRTIPALVLLLCAALALRGAETRTGATSGIFAVLIVLLLTAAAAALIGAATHNPIGELERTAAAPLPALRLAHLTPLIALACLLYGLVALTGSVAGGGAVLERNLIGLTGLALLAAAVVGAQLSWIAPLSYVIICAGALDRQEYSIWEWLTLPPRADATLTASALLAAGLAAATLRGTRTPYASSWAVSHA